MGEYPRPIVEQSVARTKVIDAVEACRREAASRGEGVDRVPVAGAGGVLPSVRAWGSSDGWPLIVEEDVALLIELESVRAEDGWVRPRGPACLACCGVRQAPTYNFHLILFS